MTTPDDISGLVSWYTASPDYCFTDSGATTACADGDLVYTWLDRKGTNHLVQSTSGLRPTYRDSGGYRWVDFGGTQYLDYSGTWVTAHPLSMAVWGYITANATVVPVCLGVSGSSSNRWILGESSSKVTATTAFQASSAIVIPTSVWSHWVATFTSGTARAAYVQGGNKGTNASSSTPSGVNLSRVGAAVSSGGATSIFTGRMAEVTIWSVSLSDTNVIDLFGAGVPTRLSSFWPDYQPFSRVPKLRSPFRINSLSKP